MKTILWATLSANGNYARASAEHPPKPEATADFAEHALAHGNFIVGRRTFEAVQAALSAAGVEMPFPEMDDAAMQLLDDAEKRITTTIDSRPSRQVYSGSFRGWLSSPSEPISFRTAARSIPGRMRWYRFGVRW